MRSIGGDAVSADKGPVLTIVPCTLSEANAFVKQYHRHHPPVAGHKFSLAVCDPEGVIHGVAIVGRPNNTHLDDGMTLEVKRVATDGVKNACSALYGACRRAVFALGFRKLVTYTLVTESGSSLRGAGWRIVAQVRGNQPWNHLGRPRVDKHPLQAKLRWEAPPPG